jgi:glycosyltransferase involved in cell wall biosynthesis
MVSVNNFKISVVIPTYNRPSLLEETIFSVFEQTFKPWELIIGDDSPDDKTEKMVQSKLGTSSPFPIKYFHNRPAFGEALNVDKLFSRAQGDAILLLHDDDPIYPHCVEWLAQPLIDSDEVIASFGMQRIISESGSYVENSENINRDFFRIPERGGKVDGFLAGAVCMFPNNGYLVRAKEAKTLGYDDKGRAGYARDFYFGFRLGRLGKPFYFVPRFTAKCRITTASESRGNPNADNAYRAVKILLEDLSPSQLDIPEIFTSLKWRMPLAITTAAVKKERKLALKWMFSKYYIHTILSPRWIKRLFLILMP